MDGGLLVGVIEHGLQEATQGALIFLGDQPVLGNNRVLLKAEGFTGSCLSNTGQDVRDIEAHNPSFAQIGSRGIARPCLVIGLGSLNDAASGGSLVLGQSAALPFVAQPGPDLFRIVQNLSSKVFTNAS